MTEELNKAAQQALKALKAMETLFSPVARDSTQWVWIHKSRDAVAALERALTQRPAAQEVDERAAFEAWAKALPLPLDGHGGHYSNIRTRNNWMGWQARATLPAPQQATPTREAREADQRARMQARLATRHEGKATADFDLPAPNDSPQQAMPVWMSDMAVTFCMHCGEGVSTFCRRSGEGPCLLLLHRVIHRQVKENHEKSEPPAAQAKGAGHE